MYKEVAKYLFALILVCLVTLLTGCVSLSDPESSQDFNADLVAVVSPEQSVGQTFISRRARFNGIALWLDTDTPSAPLTLEIFYTPGQATPLFATTVAADHEILTIPIPPQDADPNQTYYLRLSTAQGEIRIFGRDEDIYPDGTAFVDDLPIEGDIAFRTSYDYDWGATFSDLRGVPGLGWLILPLGITLLLPGWLILDLTHLRKHFDLGEQIAVSIGISLAVIPVLMLWTTILGLRWGRVSVWAGAGMLLTLLGWQWFHANPRLKIKASSTNLQSFSLLLIFALTLFTRFAMVRDLAAPAWVDSVHHALITQKIIQAGGFPNSYEPHIPVEATRYHPGFHSVLATFTWLAGLDLLKGMLILGQVLNALSIFAVYLLVTTLVKDRTAGVVAALITGLFTLMPAYYTSWGRYTQLTGLLILPVGFVWMKPSLEDKTAIWPRLLAGSLALAGLFLVHYRVIAFLGCLWLADGIGGVLCPRKDAWKRINAYIGFLGILGVGSTLLASPWLIPTLKDFVIPLAQAWREGITSFQPINWRYLTPALGVLAMILAGLGLAWGTIRRQRFVFTIVVWLALLFGLANPGVLRLPFPPGFVNPTSVEIALFLPISVLGGYLVSQVVSGVQGILPSRWQRVWGGAVIFLGGGISLLGAQRLLPTLNPVTFLFREADQPAIGWVQENIPEDETILINPTGWGYGLYMGNDGGFWISPLTGRQTMPPNVLYGMNGQERTEVNQFVEELLPIGEDATQIWELLHRHAVRYVYVGGRGGVISPQSLSESQLFETLYHQNGAWIFEALPEMP